MFTIKDRGRAFLPIDLAHKDLARKCNTLFYLTRITNVLFTRYYFSMLIYLPEHWEHCRTAGLYKRNA